MSRYKGQLKASRTEMEFPHHVDIIVPPGGLGTRLDAISTASSRSAAKASTMPTVRSFGGALLMTLWLRLSLRNFPARYLSNKL